MGIDGKTPGRWFLAWWHRLLPPQRQRSVPWGVGEVWGILILVLFLWPVLARDVLMESGFFRWVYGPDFPRTWLELMQAPDSAMLRARATPWISALSFPFQVLSVLLVVRLGSGTRPYQLGLTWHRFRQNFRLGALGFMVLTPLSYGVLLLVQPEGGGEEHAFTRVVVNRATRLELTAIIFVAVVVAPIVEELLFRGVLLRWEVCRGGGGLLSMMLALLFSLHQRWDRLETGWSSRDWEMLWQALLPTLFVLGVVPVFVVARWWRGAAAGAIVGTALCFAAGHVTWPHPIPLFILGLGLGWLAQRTQSLLGPILLHALFNGVACATFVLPDRLPQAENGSEATSAATLAPACSTSTAVPGASLPRRRYASAIEPSRGETTADVTCPTSCSPRNTLLPRGGASPPDSFNPISQRLTWPRSRAITIGSWPR